MSYIVDNLFIENTILINGVDITQKLSDLGNITYNTNDILIYNGTNIVSISPLSYKTTLGLNNLTNNLQVYNLDGARGISANTISNRPAASINGNIYISTDTRTISYDNGTSWNNILPAYTGDVTSSAGNTILTLATVNSNIGTFNNVTVNAKGLVTSAANSNYLIDSGSNGILVRTALNTTVSRSIQPITNQTTVTNNDGTGGNISIGIANNPIIPGTDSITIPSGITAQRGAATVAKLRFNTTLDQFEGVRQGIFAPLGKVVQVTTGIIAVQSGTARHSFNNLAPSPTGGFSIASTTFTPIFSNSNIVLEFSIMCDHSSNNRTIVTIVNVNGALSGVTAANSLIAGRPANQSLQIVIPSQGAGVALNIDIRAGANGGGTTRINLGNNATMGNTGATTWTMTEYV
ncbi:MAG: hypothetical protein KDH96_01560 [Candidatus Riesia sp.]|nr:hypothetical protein [Candidatus Riesia sp.]